MRYGSKAVLVMAVSAVAATTWAADKTWTGNSSTAWSTAGNWSPSGVPAANSPYDFVTIPTALRYPVLSSTTTVSGLSMDVGTQLTLQSNITFTVDRTRTSTLNGTITTNGTNTRLTLTTGQSDWTNGGTLEFGSGGNFTPTADNYTANRTLINNGTIRANAGTTIHIPFATVVGGTIDGSWMARSTIGYLYIGGQYYYNRLTLQNVTLGTDFSVVSTSTLYSNLRLLDSVTNNSTQFQAPTSIPLGPMHLAVTSGNTFTFDGSGSLTLPGQSLGGTNVTTIANNGTHTLGGYGTLNVATVNNAGTIKATGGDSTTSRTLAATAINSTGNIVVDQYNTLNVSGAVVADTGSNVTMNGGTLTAGSLTLKGSLSGYGTIGNVSNSGSIRASGGTASAARTLNTGTISGTGTVTVDQYNTLNASGPVQASAVHVYGSLHTDASDWTTNSLDVTGMVHVDPGHSITANTSVTTQANSVLNVDGTLTSPTASIGGTITGSGTVHSAVTLTGTLSPGNSPGTLSFDALTIADGAQYNFEPGDLIDVNGPLTFQPGATMSINIAPGTAYGTYTLMTADSVSGTPRFMADGFSVLTYQEGNAIKAVVPEPAILGVAGAVSFVALSQRARRKVTA